jgi:hypothetical protein
LLPADVQNPGIQPESGLRERCVFSGVCDGAFWVRAEELSSLFLYPHPKNNYPKVGKLKKTTFTNFCLENKKPSEAILKAFLGLCLDQVFF